MPVSCVLGKSEHPSSRVKYQRTSAEPFTRRSGGCPHPRWGRAQALRSTPSRPPRRGRLLWGAAAVVTVLRWGVSAATGDGETLHTQGREGKIPPKRWPRKNVGCGARGNCDVVDTLRPTRRGLLEHTPRQTRTESRCERTDALSEGEPRRLCRVRLCASCACDVGRGELMSPLSEALMFSFYSQSLSIFKVLLRGCRGCCGGKTQLCPEGVYG